MSAAMKVLFVTPILSDNSTGRTYSLWLNTIAAGWQASVVSYNGDKVWEPLAGTDFAEACISYSYVKRQQRRVHLAELSRNFDVVVAVKPLPQSLGVALDAFQVRRFPLVIDIDDPDLEARLAMRPYFRGIAWRARHFRFWLRVRSADAIQRRGTVTVSNPVLKDQYGGQIVAHSRVDPGVGADHTSTTPTVAFVGTARAHKGINELRQAVALCQGNKVRLVVTAEAPSDAQPWESWIGSSTLDDGLKIVQESDIVVIPSLPVGFSTGQLPAKLVDAMLCGRAVVVSNVAPLDWAVGASGIISVAGDAHSIASKITALCDPSVRSENGAAMRSRGLALFSVESVGNDFEKACRRSIEKATAHQ
ncbi:glycosyltransferase family 4 protein [Rhodococcus sp. SORGH_AS_0303]|uniref:glycosyltransferase family 4 protein n=1 Tax=Rhodococcus sp. SORGH_AS_0303 TaxID=3041753 RepID=UPI0027D8504E|nr:glycosyltransferase family 4 protein [Rhodococcus sp. SORGH_AS_0303]